MAAEFPKLVTESLPIAAILISTAALFISGISLWLSQIRVGKIRLSQPSQIYLGPDGGGTFVPKIYVLGFLYCTSQRGRCLESMFVRLRRGETSQNFPVWVHDGPVKLVRASGIFVGANGVGVAHHFLLPPDASFAFQPGEYVLEIFLRATGEKKPILAFECKLSVSAEEARLINSPMMGLYFDWGPDSQTYIKHVKSTLPGITIPALSNLASSSGHQT